MNRSDLRILLFLLCGLPMLSLAQMNLVWEDLGPNNLGGRTRTMAFTPDGNTLYAGSVAGGLWKTTSQGDSWEKVTGFSGNQSVSSIAINGNKMYVATGELAFFKNTADPRLSSPLAVRSFVYGYLGYAGSMGAGVFVSTDGGQTFSNANSTWNTTNPEDYINFSSPFTSVQKVIVDPSTGRVIVGTLEGVYYTDDDFATITKASGTNSIQNGIILDLEMSADGQTVYACTKDSMFVSTINDATGITFNNGVNSLIPGVAVGDFFGGGRLEIATAPSNANIVYVAGVGPGPSASQKYFMGIWKSSDRGATWTRFAPRSTASATTLGAFAPTEIVVSGSTVPRGEYSMILHVGDSDENDVIVGSQSLFRYDASAGWIKFSSQVDFAENTLYVPVNVHSIAFHPTNNNVFYIGTDHEIVRTLDGGATFSRKVKGYNVAQCYSVSASADAKILAGTMTRGTILNRAVNANNTANLGYNVVQANGGKALISKLPSDGKYWPSKFESLLISGKQGYIYESKDDGNTFSLFYGFPANPQPFTAPFPQNDVDTVIDYNSGTSTGSPLERPKNYGSYFVTPMILDEVIRIPEPANNPNRTYAYIATNQYIWTITNPFGTIDSLPKWTRISYKILSDLEVTGTASGNGDKTDPLQTITALAVSGDNNHVVFAGTSNGRIVRIKNAHDPVNFNPNTMYDTVSGNLPQRWITSISIDSYNPDNMVVTFGGYDGGSGSVWRTTNAMGTNPTYTDITGNLPSVPVYCALYNLNNTSMGMILGTEWGIWSTSDDVNTDNSPNWQESNDGSMNRVPVYELTNIQYNADYDYYNYVVAATNGRGIQGTSALVSVDPSVKGGENVAGFTLYPNPAKEYTFVLAELGKTAEMEVGLYTITGLKVKDIASGVFSAGRNDLYLDLSSLQNGVYLVKAKATASGKTTEKTMKVVVVK